MKKLLSLVFTVFIALGALTVGGCGPNMRELRIQCDLCDDYFALPVNIKGLFLMPTEMSFSADKDLTFFKDAIDRFDYGDCDVKTLINGDAMLIDKTDSLGKTHYYMLWKYTKYYLMPPKISVYENNNYKHKMYVYFPFVYLDSEQLIDKHNSGMPTITEDKFYTTKFAIDDYTKFYSKLEEFEVKQNDNILELNGLYEGHKMFLTFENGKVAVRYEMPS